MTRGRATLLLPVALLASLAMASVGAPPAGGAGGTAWTVYHGNSLGTGDAPAINVAGIHHVFTSPTLNGKLFGEPLVSGGNIYVATTADTVYALSAVNGQVVWSTTVGTPVPASSLPCGDISPTVGIVGTPVIDQSRNEIFVLADVKSGATADHRLFGLNLGNGAVMLNQNAEPPDSDPLAQLQRTGLALDDGRVVFGFGGNDGDCSTYHGWLESIPEAGGPAAIYEVDPAPGQEQGAIWMGGAAPEVDSAGNVWLSIGNGSVESASQPYDGSDAVVELSPSLARIQYFAPVGWAHDNYVDADLGSSAPAMLPDGLVAQVGKSGIGYLLRAGQLGGIGGQLAAVPNVCSGDVDGGDAFTPTATGAVVYLPCETGIVAVSVTASPPSLHVLWHSATGSSGPPIVAGSLIWTISQSGILYGLSPSTGQAVTSLPIGPEANHFSTPSVGDGLLLAPAASSVVAFTAPGDWFDPFTVGMAAAPDGGGYWLVDGFGDVTSHGDASNYGSLSGKHLNAPIEHMVSTPDGRGYWLVASDGGIFSFGDAHFYGSMGGRHLNAPVVDLAPTRDGRGYWLVASDGGIFSFGDARFHGSMGGRALNQPVVGVAGDAASGGYWEVAADGGIFSFDAPFFGSTGSMRLNRSINGMASTPGGNGYWFVASDGGVFAFGRARFHGSMGGRPLNAPVVGMATDDATGGYWMVASDGGIFSFDAPFFGS